VLLRELAILIVRIFRTLRNYREICLFGKKFLIRLRKAISKNQNGRVPIRGAKRFFSYLQDLKQFLQKPRPLKHTCLDAILGRLPFAAEENIQDLQLPDGTVFRSAALKEFRLTGGLSVRVPLMMNETFPTNFLHPTPVQIDTDFLDPLHYSHYPHCFLFRWAVPRTPLSKLKTLTSFPSEYCRQCLTLMNLYYWNSLIRPYFCP